MINPIDKDKVAEFPGLLPYPHNIGGVPIKPEDAGKIKSRALSAMQEQANRQLRQIQKQAELLAQQANEIKKRVEISEQIYTASMRFDPLIGHCYHLYQREQEYSLMMIGPEEWGRSSPRNLTFVCTVKLLSDHTWEII